MPRTLRHRIRLSPLFIRFSEPIREAQPHSILRFYSTEDMENGEDKTTEFYLHPRKGWRKRRVS